MSLKHTWTLTSPVGYMHKGVWNSLRCKSTYDGSSKALNECFKGKYIWLFGDSTTRQFFTWFQPRLDLTLTTDRWTVAAWHNPSNATSADKTINMFLGMHAMPFYHRGTLDTSSSAKGIHLYLDGIPAGAKGVAVIHVYLHFLAYYPDIVRLHVRKTKESVLKLLKRAPEVKIVVKGSHAFHDTPGPRIDNFYDFWGQIYDRIWKEEFSPLINEVIFLNGWDMTMAGENYARHPNGTLLSPLLNHMLSFICP